MKEVASGFSIFNTRITDYYVCLFLSYFYSPQWGTWCGLFVKKNLCSSAAYADTYVFLGWKELIVNTSSIYKNGITVQIKFEV